MTTPAEAAYQARIARLVDAHGWAGYRAAHFARATGTMVVILDAREAGIEDDPDAPRWATLCDDHGGVVMHYTLADARHHAAAPDGWCDECRAAMAQPDRMVTL